MHCLCNYTLNSSLKKNVQQKFWFWWFILSQHNMQSDIKHFAACLVYYRPASAAACLPGRGPAAGFHLSRSVIKISRAFSQPDTHCARVAG